MYSCTSRRLTSIESATSALPKALSYVQNLGSFVRLSFVHLFFVVSCCFCRILDCKDPVSYRHLPFWGLLWHQRSELSLYFNDTALPHFIPLVSGMKKGSITPLLREMRPLRTCEASDTCVEDQTVESVPFNLQSFNNHLRIYGVGSLEVISRR